MTFISNVPLPDPAKVFQSCLAMRRKRLPEVSRLGTLVTILPRSTSRLQEWFNSPNSSLSLLRGTFQLRSYLKEYCVDKIDDFRAANIPVLWALKPIGKEIMHTISEVDLLKYLILQTLRLSSDLQTEGSLALNCRRFQSATTLTEWFDLLGSTLSYIPTQIYIIIDLEILSPTSSPDSENFMWLRLFSTLFQKLSERGTYLRVKVMLITYGSVLMHSILNGICQVTLRMPVIVRNSRRGHFDPLRKAKFSGKRYGARYTPGNDRR